MLHLFVYFEVLTYETSLHYGHFEGGYVHINFDFFFLRRLSPKGSQSAFLVLIWGVKVWKKKKKPRT